VLSEISAAEGDIIVFIDELHTLIGAGKADGAMDASNMLKPALARGELHCVGATTLDEYRKHIEKDAALARRFQPVFVAEPSVEDTISILRGLKEKYELHHGVRIADAAIVAAATLSNRYIADRFLPDKAIDLMDEASSRIRMQVDSKPEELDELDRRIIQLKIEKEALKKESDNASRDRLERLDKELSELEQKSAALTAQWKSATGQARRFAERSRSSSTRRVPSSRSPSAGASSPRGRARLRRDPRPREENQGSRGPRDPRRQGREGRGHARGHRRRGVRAWTGVPVDKMLEGERAKLLRMEDQLHKRVDRQDEAVSGGVRRGAPRARRPAGPNRPIGSFCSWARLASARPSSPRSIAQFLFDDDQAMVRIDMSEFMEKHSVSRLIGAPPGYVGYDEGGVLTEAGAPPALSGDPVRRGREGASRRVQRPAAGARRRRLTDGQGPHGRLQEHPDRADVEPRQCAPGGAARGRIDGEPSASRSWRRCVAPSGRSSSTGSTRSCCSTG